MRHHARSAVVLVLCLGLGGLGSACKESGGSDPAATPTTAVPGPQSPGTSPPPPPPAAAPQDTGDIDIDGNGSETGSGLPGPQGPLGPINQMPVANAMAVSGTLSLDLGLDGSPSPTEVLAVSADGTRTAGTYDAATGKFSVPLPRDTDANYAVLLIDGNATGADMVVGKFQAGDLNTLSPTQSSADALELGEVLLSAGAAGEVPNFVADAALDAVLAATELSVEDAKNYGAYDDAMLSVVNVDVDGDGKIDERGDFRVEPTFGFSSHVDPNQATLITAYENKFLPDDMVFTKGRFALNVLVKRTKFATPPATVTWTFAEEMKLDESGGSVGDTVIPGMTPTAVDGGIETWKVTVPAGTPITKKYTPPSDPDMGTAVHAFGVMTDRIPNGTVTLAAGGKTITFKNLKVANYNEVPPVVPFVKINVEAGLIKGIDFKWMARKQDGSGWELATKELTRLFVGKAGGHLSMYVVDGNNVRTNLSQRLEWTITPEEMEGTIPFDTATACLVETSGGASAPACSQDNPKLRISRFDSIDAAKAVPFSSWGHNNFTFLDKLGMMISVN